LSVVLRQLATARSLGGTAPDSLGCVSQEEHAGIRARGRNRNIGADEAVLPGVFFRETFCRAGTIGGKISERLYSSSNGKQKFKTSCESGTEITQAIRPEAC
jgi:hypothetical protein